MKLNGVSTSSFSVFRTRKAFIHRLTLWDEIAKLYKITLFDIVETWYSSNDLSVTRHLQEVKI